MRATMAVAAAVVAGAVAPAGAGAVEVSVGGNDLQATPVKIDQVGSVTIRRMTPVVGVSFAPNEANLRYQVEILRPDGVRQGGRIFCTPTTQPKGLEAEYHGNGTYTVRVTFFARDDEACSKTLTGGAEFRYNVNAFTALQAPTDILLTRKPGDFALLQYGMPIDMNPGSNWAAHDVWYALNEEPNPDAGIGKQAFVDQTSPVVPVRFQEPGQYTFKARVRGAGGIFTAWSPPVTMKVVAPFDFKSRLLTWTDNRGPSYRVRVRVREPGARGRVTFRLARGKKRGRYRRIGTARISRRGAITKRFKVRRTGNYRLRISYKGNELVAGGHVTFRVRFKRRIIFRSSASSVG